MPKVFAYEVQDEFLDLVCGGLSITAAEAAVGVGARTGWRWWQRCGLVDVVVQIGAGGGLRGSAPAGVPGASGDDTPRVRRPLSSEDRAVIAAGLRRGMSHAQIGELIGRHRSVIMR